MDLKGIMLSGISQTEKTKYHMISLLWNLQKPIKMKQNQTLRYREQAVVARGERGGRTDEIGERD